HLVDDLLCQVFAVAPDIVDDGFLDTGIHQVEDFCSSLYATHLAALEILAVQHAAEDLGELLQGSGLHAAECGDAQYHIVAQLFVEQFQDIGSLAALQVDQNGGDDLGVLVANHFRHGGGLNQVERVDAGIGVVDARDILHQAAGTFGPKYLGKDGEKVFTGPDAEQRELLGVVVEIGENLVHFLIGDMPHGSHSLTQLLDLHRRHVAHHIGGTVLVEAQHQDGALAQARVTVE